MSRRLANVRIVVCDHKENFNQANMDWLNGVSGDVYVADIGSIVDSKMLVRGPRGMKPWLDQCAILLHDAEACSEFRFESGKMYYRTKPNMKWRELTFPAAESSGASVEIPGVEKMLEVTMQAIWPDLAQNLTGSPEGSISSEALAEAARSVYEMYAEDKADIRAFNSLSADQQNALLKKVATRLNG